MSEFREVPGTNGRYSMSILGEVIGPLGKKLKPVSGTEGYLFFCIYPIPGWHQNRSQHRMLAETWLPNPENLPMVLHRNDIKDDNRIENLRWGNSRENVLDSIANGTHHNSRKTHCKYGHRVETWPCGPCRVRRNRLVWISKRDSGLSKMEKQYLIENGGN